MEQVTRKNIIRVDEDILDVICIGEFSLADMNEVIDIAEAIIAQHGHYFTLTDVSRMDGLHPLARRRAAEWASSHPVAAIIMYGAKLPTRAVLTLLTRAMNILRPEPFPFIFTQSHQEGRDWITTHRKETLEQAKR